MWHDLISITGADYDKVIRSADLLLVDVAERNMAMENMKWIPSSKCCFSLSGKDVCALMKKNRVSIVKLCNKMNVPKEYVQHLRESGIFGRWWVFRLMQHIEGAG